MSADDDSLDLTDRIAGRLDSRESLRNLRTGPLWRPVNRASEPIDRRLTVDAIADTIKRHATSAGLDPERISPHSLRSGPVTEAKRNDAPDLAVMSQTHHARTESIVGYVREGDPFRHTSAKYLGL